MDSLISKLHSFSDTTMRRTVVILVASLPLLGPVRVRAELEGDESIAPAQFLARYRKAVRDLEAEYRDVRIEGISRYFYPQRAAAKKPVNPGRSGEGAVSSSRSERLREFSYIYCNGNERASFRPASGAGESVFVSTKGASFGLAKQNKPDQPYVLRNVSSGSNDFAAMRNVRLRVRDAPYRLAGHDDYLEWLVSPRFNIDRVTRITVADRPLIRAFFNYQLVPPGGGEARYKGHLDLDESIGLAIRGYEFNFERMNSTNRFALAIEGSVSYKTEQGHAVPTQVKLSQRNAESGRADQSIYDITAFSLEPAPPEAFTLADFGLGDYERTVRQVERRSSYRTSALAVAAFLVAFILFVIGRKIGRSRAVAKGGGPGDQALGSGSPPLEEPS